MSTPAASVWRFQRALARVEATVEAVVAEHATSYWHRPVRRQDTPASVMWRIDGEAVVEFRFSDDGPSALVVYELSLVDLLKRRVRTRHVVVREASGTDWANA